MLKTIKQYIVHSLYAVWLDIGGKVLLNTMNLLNLNIIVCERYLSKKIT